jgi:tetratricopeptide (TPR) repeat protein
MGVVYAAYDPQLDRKVAVKVLSQNSDIGQARLLREAQAMAKVTHANVVAVFDAGLIDDCVFVAMEFVAGQNLAEWLDAERRPWREIVRIFREAGRGLAAVHQVGLVHRDFKPENVLVGDDGRCRVSDFGLARLAVTEAGLIEPAEAEPSIKPVAEVFPPTTTAKFLSSVLTQHGTFVGTPVYMAPEQTRGAPPDALTDQFSFGVALYRALYRNLPYDLADLHAWKGGAAPPAPREPDLHDGDPVPRWIWRTLAPALAPRATDRYSNLDALLAALGRDPARVRRRVAAWVGAVGIVSSLGVLALTRGSAEESNAAMCRSADRALIGVWDSGIRRDVRDAFRATKQPRAIDTWNRTEALLDTYAQTWISAQTDACEASRIRGDQSDEIYSLRTACLDTDLKQLRDLVQIFKGVDADLESRAIQAASGLATVSRCSDIEALLATEPLPADPLQRKQYDDANAALAKATVLNLTGRTDAAEKLAVAVATQAHDRFHVLEAKAQILRSTILIDSGRHDEGVRVTKDALVAAEAGLDGGSAAHAYAILLFETGILGRNEDVEMLKRHGQVWLTHAKGEERDDATGSYLNSLGALSFYAGRWNEAADHFARAHDAYARVRPGHWLLARNLQNRAEALLRGGSYAEAREAGDRALAIKTRALGENHPELISTINLAARIRLAIHDEDQAITLANRARDLARASGASLDQAESLEIMGEAYTRSAAGEDRALVVVRDSLRLTETETLRQSEIRGNALQLLGDILLRRNAAADAVPTFEESLAIREHSQGKAGPLVADSLIGLGCAHTMLDNPAAAVSAFERAEAIVGRASVGDTVSRLAQRLLADPEARVAGERLLVRPVAPRPAQARK